MSAEAENKYKIMWGARVLTPVDVPDDILKYSITLVRDKLQSIGDNVSYFFNLFDQFFRKKAEEQFHFHIAGR